MALTRTDRVAPVEFQDMVLDRIYMRSSEFPRPLFACIAIVNRTSDDIVTLAEHQAMEEQWFERWVVGVVRSGRVLCVGGQTIGVLRHGPRRMMLVRRC